MSADAAAAKSAAVTPVVAKKKRRTPLWIALALSIISAAGGGWWWSTQMAANAGAQAATRPAAAGRAEAHYFALEPAFVVNLADADQVRYLQADVQLMTRDAATLAAFERHAPAIRNRLLLLFGQQSAAQLMQRSAKERLQEQALVEVRSALRKEHAATAVEAVLFTSLVTQ